MKEYKLKKNIFFKLLLLNLFVITSSINAQIVIGTPSLGFSQACASEEFNSYEVSFSFSPEEQLLATNQFILELSDETGSFTSPTVIYTSNQGEITTSPASISFSFPTTVAGEAYKLRIKSTSPAATSAGSSSFAAYYKVHDTPFSINNLVPSGIFCSGGSYLLTIDNPGKVTNITPLQFPSLTYNWYKEKTETTYEFVAEGETLLVSESGTYFVETNYGSCTSNSYSNRVTVLEAGSDVEAPILSSLGNPFCEGEGSTILSTVVGDSYKWFFNGEKISGATSRTYSTTESGEYMVEVDVEDCSITGTIDLKSVDFSSSIDVPEINYLESGERLEVTITTDADNPIFEWYLNDILISEASSNHFEAYQLGNYRVEVTQTEGCIATQELLFRMIEPFPDVDNIPNLISPNGDGVNDTWIIPQAYVSGTNTRVIIFNEQRDVLLDTSSYMNDWPQDQSSFSRVHQVYYYVIMTSENKVKKGTITVIK